MLHCASAGVTVLGVQLRRDSPIHHLFWRRKADEKYQALGTPASEQSFEEALSCEEPTIFWRVVQWRPVGDGMAGRPLGLFKASLSEPPVIEEVDLSDLLPPEAYVSRLLRANDAGTVLTVVACFRRRSPSYRICTLDLIGRRLHELNVLRSPFF
jgi:hypothetical protein